MTVRLELPNGDWVDFVSRLNHAQQRRISESVQSGLDAATEGVAAMVTGWALRDVDGGPIPFPELAARGIPSEALDTVPMDTFVAMGEKAVEIATGEPVPKAGGETSPRSSMASASPTRTRTSRTPSSSTAIPDGPGMPFNQPRPT